jgi:ABC-2 type transport system ATP-binding protein
MMDKIVLQLKNIHKSFYQKEVLCGIDIEIREGMIIGLIGKNGVGKSTLIKIALGLLKSDKGDAILFGKDVYNMDSVTKHRIGYVPQVMSGFRWMRIETMLDYTGAFYKTWNKKKVDYLLKEWDLDPWTKISNLSEGERQKLAIIQAMGHEPDLYIFDEPVASLDPVARRKFIQQLIELNIDAGKTMLFSTHITSDLERVAADITLLNNGVITLQGDLASLKERIKRLHIKSKSTLPAKISVDNSISQIINQHDAIVTVDGITEEGINTLEKQLNASVSVEYLNLEEIFLELNK